MAVVHLNVGGHPYCTTRATLSKDATSTLAAVFATDADVAAVAAANGVVVEQDGVHYIDRDGQLFRFVLDYLRTSKVTLPQPFPELERLREEAKHFHLQGMIEQLSAVPAAIHAYSGGAAAAATPLPPRPASANGSYVDGSAGHITIGYRGTFAFGRDGQADVNFRKLNRILVSGKAALCREVFGESLNESRDPDREGAERYTARLFLKHQSLEKACDTLAENGFKLTGSCASGANGLGSGGTSFPLMPGPGNAQDSIYPRSSGDYEELRWSHYTEYIFFREPGNKSI